MEKIKVLHIVTAFPRSDAEDSMTPWMIGTMRELEKLGVHNVILAPSYKGLGDQTVFGLDVRRFRYFPKFWEDLTHDETTPVRLKRRPWYIIHVPFLLFFGWLYVKRLLNREDFDILQVHWPFPMGIIGSPGTGKMPVIHKFYTAEAALVKKSPFFRWMLKGIFKKADRFLAISSYAAKMFEGSVPKKITVIAEGSRFPDDVPAFKAPPEEGPYNILFVGRMVERKGIRYLIEAMPHVLQSIEAHLTLVGVGAEKEGLERLTKDLKLSDNISFPGRVTHQEKIEAYRKSHVFVLPACFDSAGDTEGLGVVLLEALGYGKPVIASEVGGIVDIVKHEKTGLLVPEKDPKALADAIVRMLKDPDLYMRLAKDGYEYGIEHFSVPSTARQTRDVYLEMLT